MNKWVRTGLVAFGVTLVVLAFLGVGPDGSLPTSALVGGIFLILIAAGVDAFDVLKGPGGFEMRPRHRPEEMQHDLEELESGRGQVSDESELANIGRAMAAQAAIVGLLDSHSSPMPDVEYRLFMFDEDAGRLLPLFEPDSDESDGWFPGQGVTGVAYLRRSYVWAREEATHDGTFGLTPEQQARYSNLTAVASMPIFDDDGGLIAVLSGSTTNDSASLLGEDGSQWHALLAIAISRVLIDLLGVGGA